MMPGPGTGRARTGGFRAFVSSDVFAGPAGIDRALRSAWPVRAAGGAGAGHPAGVVPMSPRPGRGGTAPAGQAGDTGFGRVFPARAGSPIGAPGRIGPASGRRRRGASQPPREWPPRRPTRGRHPSSTGAENGAPPEPDRDLPYRSVDAKQLRADTAERLKRLSATSESRPDAAAKGSPAELGTAGRQPSAPRNPGRTATTPR